MRRWTNGYCQRSASGAIEIYRGDNAAKRSKCDRCSGELPSAATEAYTWNRHGCVVAAIRDGLVCGDLVKEGDSPGSTCCARARNSRRRGRADSECNRFGSSTICVGSGKNDASDLLRSRGARD